MNLLYFGIDGCKAGWFWIGLGDDDEYSHGLVQSFPDLLVEVDDPVLIAVDIPIGLRTECERERLCDLKARNELGQPRGSSVFPTPCRPAVYEPSLENASDVNRNHTGRGLSQQAVHLIPKIREVDKLLRDNARARSVTREIHPEVCFWALNRQQPMKHSKKDREGLLKRFHVLTQYDHRVESIVAEALLRYPRNSVARDDILDAMSGAITASHPDELATLPENPERDREGLLMEMVYWEPSS